MSNVFTIMITKASNAKIVEDFCVLEQIGGLVLYGKGSAKKSIWNLLGLTDNSKIALVFNKELEAEKITKLNERCKDLFVSQIGGNMTDERLFICIINSGYAEEVMDIARSEGATGGTILDGRGTGKTAEHIWGTEVNSAKEVVLIFGEEQLAKKLEEKIGEYIKNKDNVSGICFTINAKLYRELNTKNN